MIKATLIVGILLLSACGASGDGADEESVVPALEKPDPITNEAPIPAASLLTCPTGTHLTYENFGESFLRNFCVMCHSAQLADGKRGGAPLNANFDNASDASLWRAAMLSKAGADGSPQPPINNVPSLERAQFAEWLACGAPRN